MKLSLSANISRLRKEHSMTQEQLAEALGVTFAAVSKWERGVSTPELNLIAEIADLFEVSLDALIGYEFRNNSRENVIARLKQYVHDRNNEDIWIDIEKALQRYPNCFEVVYYIARIYRVRGLTQKNIEYSKKALSLYSRACLLIKQNEDSKISDTSIQEEMAEIYLALGEYEKGIELLKQNNPCQVNHPMIGYTLASSCDDPEGARPYLSTALIDLTVTHMKIVMGYINVFCKTKDYANALDIVDWALAFYPGLKNSRKSSYLDKSEAILWAVRADILLTMGKMEETMQSLRKAKKLALQFDKAPDYDVASIRFVSCETPATAFDDMGDTAMLSLDNMIAEFERDSDACCVHEEVAHSESAFYKQNLQDLWRLVKAEAGAVRVSQS